MSAVCFPAERNTLLTPWVSIEFGLDIYPGIRVVTADLRTIYTAATVEEVEMRLAEFVAK
jgi:hypothetical protein